MAIISVTVELWRFVQINKFNALLLKKKNPPARLHPTDTFSGRVTACNRGQRCGNWFCVFRWSWDRLSATFDRNKVYFFIFLFSWEQTCCLHSIYSSSHVAGWLSSYSSPLSTTWACPHYSLNLPSPALLQLSLNISPNNFLTTSVGLE